ncbi:unnamed protein product [Chrysodeixis includens]|uniref:Uncharacterized protein n=1 Tax=Chrysodeixis includens TaxID=689277 RepID=A0A9P0C2Y1_CHRIL|nr:unnamed protein product [Chrysodeixis includens]
MSFAKRWSPPCARPPGIRARDATVMWCYVAAQLDTPRCARYLHVLFIYSMISLSFFDEVGHEVLPGIMAQWTFQILACKCKLVMIVKIYLKNFVTKYHNTVLHQCRCLTGYINIYSRFFILSECYLAISPRTFVHIRNLHSRTRRRYFCVTGHLNKFFDKISTVFGCFDAGHEARGVY